MFAPPALPKTLVYFGPVKEVAKLHEGEDFTARLEEEIRIHQGQIQAENLLLNTVARYRHVADAHHISRDDFNAAMRESHYQLDIAKKILMEKYGIPEAELNQPLDAGHMDTADYMRQRAAMMGSVLSSTPVLLRDPWGGKPATAQYGFTDFKAEVD